MCLNPLSNQHNELSNPWIILVACSLNVAIFASSQSGVNIALPTIQHDLNFSNEIQQWVINSFTLGSACTFVIFGKIGKMISAKRMYLLGIVIMMGASIGCAFAVNGPNLLVFRFIQGVAVAMSAPAGFTLIRESITDGDYDKYFSWFITLNTSYFITCPIIYGYVVEYFSWHWVFLLIIPLGLFAFISILLFGQSKAVVFQKFDTFGAVLLSISTFVLVYVFMSVGYNGITGNNQVLFILFIITSMLFIRHIAKKEDSIFPIRLFKKQNVAMCAHFGFTLQGCLMVMAFINLLLLEHFQLSPVKTGYFLMFATTSGLISPYIFSKFTNNSNRKQVIIITLTCLMLAFLGLGISAYQNSLISCFVFACSFAFLIGPLLSALPSQISNTVDHKDVQETNAIVFHFRYMGASLCTAVMGIIAYGSSSSTEDNISNSDFLHVMIFMSIIVLIAVVSLAKYMRSPKQQG